MTDGPPRNSLINFLSSDYVNVGDLHWVSYLLTAQVQKS